MEMHQNSSDLFFFSWLSKPKINDLGRPHPAYSIITPLRMILLKVPLRTNLYHAVAMHDDEDGDLFDAIIKPKGGERGCRLIESSDKPLFFSRKSFRNEASTARLNIIYHEHKKL